MVQFEFGAFQLLSTYSMLYVQCQLVICQAQDLTSRCYQGCVSRQKRSPDTYLEVVKVIAGPVKLQRKHNQKREIGYTALTQDLSDTEHESQSLLLPYCLTTLALVLVILALAGFLWREKLRSGASFQKVEAKEELSRCNIHITNNQSREKIAEDNLESEASW
uniref:CUB and zona pellucida-like domain-containing protein 1 n=1 Tax=Geotrypetes seraphini TaxID=260995 RepID=A0A6P8QKY3_GEOSA|nr:CUB and zona pellucida-like domain-containing protein 1 [Geotrypetes seraphini]